MTDTPHKFYVDEDASERVTPALRERGYDAISTREIGQKGRKDPWQLVFAARQRRVLVTCNVRDFEMLHDAWVLWSQNWSINSKHAHAGILVIPNGREATVAQMVQIIHKLALRGDLLDNAMFRWRHVTGWRKIVPPSLPV